MNPKVFVLPVLIDNPSSSRLYFSIHFRVQGVACKVVVSQNQRCTGPRCLRRLFDVGRRSPSFASGRPKWQDISLSFKCWDNECTLCKLLVIHYSAQGSEGTQSGSGVSASHSFSDALEVLDPTKEYPVLNCCLKPAAAATIGLVGPTNCRAVPKVGLVLAFQSAIKER